MARAGGGKASAAELEKKMDAKDREIIKTGLQLFIKNERAAANTMRGLNKHAEAELLIREADDIQDRLLPKFDDQTVLDFPGAEGAEE